jgi:hypothetical protein
MSHSNDSTTVSTSLPSPIGRVNEKKRSRKDTDVNRFEGLPRNVCNLSFGNKSMIFVCLAVAAGLILMVLVQRELLVCADLIERGLINAPKPTPFIWSRNTKEFLDFVIKGRYRSSSDASIRRPFGLLRALIFTHVLLFAVTLCYVLTL